MYHGRGGNKHIVNASQGKCQCGKWQSYYIPCSHAIKGFDQIGYQAWEHMAPEFCVRSYKKVDNVKVCLYYYISYIKSKH